MGLILINLLIFGHLKTDLRILPFCFVPLTVYLQLGWDLTFDSGGMIRPILKWLSKKRLDEKPQ